MCANTVMGVFFILKKDHKLKHWKSNYSYKQCNVSIKIYTHTIHMANMDFSLMFPLRESNCMTLSGKTLVNFPLSLLPQFHIRHMGWILPFGEIYFSFMTEELLNMMSLYTSAGSHPAIWLMLKSYFFTNQSKWARWASRSKGRSSPIG